ncbi:MAG: ATP synthase F1 subunit gamma [Flavobacterium sp.]|jgi:F-type H+-transporting ATPase subunit gamma|uniref:ATP synthase F1 subunit gamma n=1 Tax=unclassified Flavobacterium TaxID=196869 RepID=UPI000C188437|nr:MULTISPECIES: ATP synthase F1 subunit gamma [unclassified Flavobacterium]MDI6048401.1 ATP synthase F1 subunit gamma [Flavobacterium sp. XS2P24]MDP3682035.1 ATP synthase F1 subunit gamma [Flavobacterium sp.]MDZ4329029.1 ATP synthase F1 subunit gamma [Flavobacterium sp.]PIF61351.1 ATP synthase F1 subcomplex gamma subunit [Flavobacterium sp. 11]RKS15724.1 ATP synthase F1 subcomplex gamma subunit [Flavobacterium sp. 120]
MANLKEIRNRITSVSSTMQITSAMKMVSAAKLKKAQDAITAMRPYAEKLTELLQNLSATLEGDAGGEFTTQREIKKVLVVAITSNRGLCGAFNTNVIKEAKSRSEVYAGKQVDIFAIGKKGNDVLSKTLSVVDNQSTVFDDLTFDNVAKIADLLTEKFVSGEYDKIELIYNQFKNAATQIVQTEQFLPLAPIKSDLTVSTGDYIFEPSKEEIVLTLIPKSLKTQLYKGIRDSFASEHGARMTAMHKATDNATELRNQLKLTYNKARQAAITNEILEIVGGAEALNG